MYNLYYVSCGPIRNDGMYRHYESCMRLSYADSHCNKDNDDFQNGVIVCHSIKHGIFV